MANFLTLPIFKEVILPFILIFTLIFAILEKSKLLGEGKQQVNAIIGFVIAGLLVGFGNAVNYITQLTVFLSVGLVILFVFMLLFGFVSGAKEGDVFKEYGWIKLGLGVIVFIAVVVATLMITNVWDNVYNFFTSEGLGQNIIFIILIVIAIAAVLFGGKKKD